MQVDLFFFMAVCAGGGLGAMARAALSSWISRHAHVAWATLAVNLSGSAALGLACGALMAQSGGVVLSGMMEAAPPALAVFALGVLGGYTTVSTLALQVLMQWQAGRRRAACANALGSVLSGPVVTVLGLAIGVALVRGA
ncbi:fluoride efflux transporter FluC [Roseinatronobacter alkalisoli]|uniref:Fluoride-specific ion channel FluC n=1 Tax=Roseinatronobacter alkalisoli TaxID=3028235 RepID=A0ABT5T4T0_9RHOB|nr:CrcB family protein [Roseinatronobacter sp. HJB301]MDD7970059.1 CrcB family protein [Roseinatronobacter sp. HJB301]